MSWFSAIPVVGKVIDGLFGLIDKAVTDKDEANQLKAKLEQILLDSDLTKFQSEIKAQASIVLAEAQGQSWLQRNWRPLLMLIVISIIANNYIIFPYLSIFWPEYVVVLELPDKLYSLMTVGVGGYVVGRTTEKGITTWKEKK